MQKKQSNITGAKSELNHFSLLVQTHFCLVIKNCLAGPTGLAGCPVLDGISLLQHRAAEETKSPWCQEAKVVSVRNYFTADKCAINVQNIFKTWEKFTNPN